MRALRRCGSNPICTRRRAKSILRQFAYGARYASEKLGVVPDVAWLPDTFGFPNTLPTLAAHAGVHFFATTKLQWNETTRWPYPQFCWYGDDGSHLVSAVIDRYDGEATPNRRAIARERDEILVHGYGDGGGGVLDHEIAAEDRATRPWCSVAAWFADVDRRELPQYRGELYLETHRGTYTTHRDVKSRNAALERSLGEAEELCAWCIGVRAPASAIAPLLDDLRTAWTIVLRNQFHDVMAGSAIAAAYVDVLHEYERAERIVERVIATARSILPRADLVLAPAAAGGAGGRRRRVRIRQRLSAGAGETRWYRRRTRGGRRPQPRLDRQRADALRRQAAHLRRVEPRRGLRTASAQAACARRVASRTMRSSSN